MYCERCGFNGKGDVGYDIQGYLIISCPECQAIRGEAIKI